MFFFIMYNDVEKYVKWICLYIYVFLLVNPNVGASTVELARIYRLGVCTAGRIIKETCPAICIVLKKRLIKLPRTPEGWMEQINAYDHRWQYPACVGALDGKHVKIKEPCLAGLTYYNYKGFHSIVLMGLVKANYMFLYADVGAEGAMADGGVWRNCELRQDIDSGKVRFPPDLHLKGSNATVSCHIIGDDAFPMSTYLHI